MRTYDMMAKLVIEARPDLDEKLVRRNLVDVLTEHFPIEGGWRSKPLAEGEKLLREVIAEK